VHLKTLTVKGFKSFASATALVDATAGGATDAAAYARAWPRLARRQIGLGRLVLRLAEDGALRRRVMIALRDAPESFRAFLALATGAWGWGRALPGVARLGLRMLASRSARAAGEASARAHAP